MNFVRLTDSSDFRDPDLSNSLIHSQLSPSSLSQTTKFPSFKLVIKGEETYTIGRRAIRVTPGEMLFVKSGTTATVTTQRNSETTGMCYYFGAPEYAPLDELYFKITLPPRLRRSAFETSDAVGDGRACAALLEDFKNELVQYGVKSLGRLSNLSEKTNLLRHSARADIVAKLEQTRTYIRKNVTRAITLDELSEVAGLSKFYLAHHYRRVYAVSPVRDHQNARIDLAAQMLKTRADRLEDVAQQVGYADFSSFAKAFKRRYGRSPGLYKRQHRT